MLSNVCSQPAGATDLCCSLLLQILCSCQNDSVSCNQDATYWLLIQHDPPFYLLHVYSVNCSLTAIVCFLLSLDSYCSNAHCLCQHQNCRWNGRSTFFNVVHVHYWRYISMMNVECHVSCPVTSVLIEHFMFRREFMAVVVVTLSRWHKSLSLRHCGISWCATAVILECDSVFVGDTCFIYQNSVTVDGGVRWWCDVSAACQKMVQRLQ
jgi:hypothetical protein